jgi:hypothetical protein
MTDHEGRELNARVRSGLDERAAGFVEELIWRSQNENRVVGALLHGSFRPEPLQATTHRMASRICKESGTFAQSRHWSDPRS